ncbi:hypothetical protein [Methylobacterium sp. A54F]
MKKLATLGALTLALAGPVLTGAAYAQGRSPGSSSASSGNAEENNKPASNSAGGGGSGR